MKNVMFVFLFALAGCHQINKLTGVDDSKNTPKAEQAHQFITVACCQDNNASGHPTYPAFLPAGQVQLCLTAEAACHNADCQINGDTYLPNKNDCGHGHNTIGDEYYVGKGY